MPISKRNRRGVLILGAILLVVIYLPRILSGYLQDAQLEYSVEELDEADQQIRESLVSRKEKFSKKKKSRYSKPLSTFDPNEYTQADWMNLGLSEKQANVVLRFTEHGVYSNDELKKIFVISEELFLLIKDSTFYPMRPKRISKEKGESVEYEKEKVELNTATFDELIQINGIGDYYADKIIEYRTKLGGYHEKEQLLELWKFTSEKLDEIGDQITVNGSVQKLNINDVSYDDLRQHPYISSKVANSIVKMRTQRGKYENLEDLLESKLIDFELFNKLEPYIKL